MTESTPGHAIADTTITQEQLRLLAVQASRTLMPLMMADLFLLWVVYTIGEVSGISLPTVVPTLSWLLVKCYFWRMKEKYLIRDFHPLVFFLTFGEPSRQIDQIKASIAAFGFTNPILADIEGKLRQVD